MQKVQGVGAYLCTRNAMQEALGPSCRNMGICFILDAPAVKGDHMRLLVSHLSALRYWRSANELEVRTAKPSRVRSLGDSVTNVKQARLLEPKAYGFVMTDDYPLNVLVSDSSRRRPSKELAPRVWGGELPPRAFRRIADGLYVSSPEFVFLQLAGELDVIELARLGNELCGKYNLRRGERFTQRDAPLTSKAKLTRMVDRMRGSHGSTKAKEALHYVCDGSASPQETNMLLALCLPRRFGGYGLPLPELNPKVEVGERLGAYIGGNYYFPDALWSRVVRNKRRSITVEYDSHEAHDLEKDAEHTRIRRNEFKTMGYLVTSINKSQMRDARRFLFAARQIARDLGIWRKEPDIAEVSACDQLLMKLANETVF